MTREQAKILAPIIQAFGEGKEIQYKHDDKWINPPRKDSEVCFNPDTEFRIKPEPREFWTNLFNLILFETKEEALKYGADADSIIKVREVLD